MSMFSSLIKGLGKTNSGMQQNLFGSIVGKTKSNPLSGLAEMAGAAGLVGGQFAPTPDYVPITAQTINTPSQASQANPTALNAQLEALDRTRANSDQRINSAERDNLYSGINKVNLNTQARSNAIRQDAAARNLGGSGLEQAMRSSNEQGGANAANEAGIQAQNAANMRALDSVKNLGILGGEINDQQYRRGQAADALSMYNTDNINNMAQFNTSNNLQNQQFNSGGAMQNQQQNAQNYQNNQQFNAQMANNRRGQNIGLAGAAIGGAGAVAGRR